MTIISFKPKPKDTDYIFVCNCGCASFELRGDGAAVCRGCATVIDDEGAWKQREEGAPEYSGSPSYSDAGNDPDFAERKVKRDAASADWIIFGNEAGRVTSWARSMIETEEQERWLRDGVAAGLDAILSEKPR